MKKILTLLAVVLILSATATAQDVSNLRIYINPGKGGWGFDDRPRETISHPNIYQSESGFYMPDTCGFYESNTNLWKAEKLGQKLIEAGFKPENILYSRTANGPYPYNPDSPDKNKYSRSLTEIAEEVEANNIDLYLSIQYFAAAEGSRINYPQFLFRGKDGIGNDYAQGSYEIAKTLWPLLYTNAIDPKSSYSPTNPNIRGDIDLYGATNNRTSLVSGKTYEGYCEDLMHGAKGIRVNGSCSSYQPSRHRALNRDYCEQEGVRYARGIVKFFGAKAETTGYIMGTVKDLYERIDNPLFNYIPDTNDQWLPINGATVTLYKGSSLIGEYTTDNNYNGVFVFEDLEPGDDYSLDITAQGYKPLSAKYKQPITVTANETTYPMVFLQSESYTHNKQPNYKEPELPPYITDMPSMLEFKQENHTAYNGINGTVTRILQRNDSMFVLTKADGKTPAIYFIDNATKEVKTLSMNGIQALDASQPCLIETISDIALTADGKLLACNLNHLHSIDTTPSEGHSSDSLHIYIWEDLYTDPTIWFSTQDAAGFDHALVGSTLAVSGNSKECTIITTAINNSEDSSTPEIRFIAVNINEDNKYVCHYEPKDKQADNLLKTDMGDNMQLVVSPRNDNHFIIKGSLTEPLEISLTEEASTNGTHSYEIIGHMAGNATTAKVAGIDFFKYAKHDIMVAPYANEATGKISGVHLIDITNGLENAKAIATTGTEVTDGADISLCHATVMVKGTDITLRLIQDNDITPMVMRPSEQTVMRNAFAYDLDAEDTEENYVLKFKLSGKSDDITVVLESTLNPGITTTIPVENATVGENSVTISKSKVPDTDCSWKVVVNNKKATWPKRLFCSRPVSTPTNGGGVAFVSDPESKSFGKIVTSYGKGQGFAVYSPDLKQEDIYTFDIFSSNNAYSPGRITENGGLIYACDWSDDTSGIWVFDPSDPTTTPYQLFEGTRDNSGAFAVDGNIIGGGGTGVDFIGTGADRKMFFFCEDYPTGNSGNVLVSYNIGKNRTIDSAPDNVYNAVSSTMRNSNVEVTATECGLFVSQMRSADANSVNAPCFTFINHNGDILFNSGSDLKEIKGSYGGLTINKEGNIMAIAQQDNTILISKLSWRKDNTPVITPLYSIPTETGSDERLHQLDFDISGNLYLYSRNSGLCVYSVPTLDDTVTAETPARSDLTLHGKATGINNATVTPKNNSLNLYTNSTTSTITVETSTNIRSFGIYAMTGALVTSDATVTGNKATLNVSNLALGVYIIKANNQTARFVKR